MPGRAELEHCIQHAGKDKAVAALLKLGADPKIGTPKPNLQFRDTPEAEASLPPTQRFERPLKSLNFPRDCHS
jgi:hypothetical protein